MQTTGMDMEVAPMEEQHHPILILSKEVVKNQLGKLFLNLVGMIYQWVDQMDILICLLVMMSIHNSLSILMHLMPMQGQFKQHIGLTNGRKNME